MSKIEEQSAEVAAKAAEAAPEAPAAVEAAPEAAAPATAPAKPKKKGKKGLIILIVILVILVAAGIGFYVWHNQPSFCNAICHSPMDKYVETYYAEDSNLLVAKHNANGEVCLDCHEAQLSQQIEEAKAWLSGNFKDPMPTKRLGTVDFCFRCHDNGNAEDGLDWDAIVASTVNYQGTPRNPHQSHQGMLECYNCHFMHDDSRLYCQKCHGDVSIPDSWK